MTSSTDSYPLHSVDEIAVNYGVVNEDVVTRNVLVGDRTIISERPPAAFEDSDDGFSSWWSSVIRGPKKITERDAKPFQFIDLFSSVGGLSLGAMDAISSIGRRPVPLLAADIDAGALKVYKKNIRPRATVTESVRGMLDFRVSGYGTDASFAYQPSVIDERLAAHENVDLVLAGPPCQGHSSLNNHSRHDDPKNLLYLTVPAAAVALGARHVVIENVPNVVADKHGVVQTTITLLKNEGYKLSYGVLTADQIGWPQTRKRFFLVASRDSQPMDLRTLGSSMKRDPLPVNWLLRDLSTRPLDPLDVMNSVPRLSAENVTRIDWLFDNDEHNLPNDIRPDCHKNGTTYPSTYGRMHGDKPAPTITGGFLTPGRGRFVHPTARRVLTPREAARVQGFPDWFNFVPNPNLQPSRAELSRWIGNAVPTILGYVATLAVVHGEGVLTQATGKSVSTHAA